MAKGKAKKAKSKKKSGMVSFLMLTILLSLAFWHLPVATILLCGMAPTIVAYVIDMRPQKYAAMCVGCFNLCGITPFLQETYREHHSLAQVIQKMSDPYTWVVMFGAASVGWMMLFAMPSVARVFILMRCDRAEADFKRRQKRVNDQWHVDLSSKDKGAHEEPKDPGANKQAAKEQS